MSGLPHHIDLTVGDIETSIAFYETVLAELGFRRITTYAGEAPCWAYADNPDLVFSIALHPARTRVTHDRYAPGLHHLAFNADSRDAVERFYTFLQKQDIRVLDPPAEYDYTPGYYAVFFADPDGMKLEVVYEPHHTQPPQTPTA